MSGGDYLKPNQMRVREPEAFHPWERITELEEALTHLLETQVDHPENDPALLVTMASERRAAVAEARKVLRGKI
jgi:hypothetical protein